jgi:succinoglycan biosynthesis protein ExoM
MESQMHLRSHGPVTAATNDVNAAPRAGDSTAGAALVALCIPTYRRNDLLGDCLAAVAALNVPRGHRLAVLVVDNDPDGGARAQCEAARRLGLRLEYAIEPRRGLCCVRNHLLEAALRTRADWIAFLDDDEQPAPDWLAEHLRALARSGAEVSTGPVFHGGQPARPARAAFAASPHRVPPGAPRFVACNNVIFRRTLPELQGLRFDPLFNLSGGEDFDFFESSRRLGNRHVWCDSAHVFETVSPERSTLRYLFHRHWSGAMTRVAQHRKWHGGPLLWPRFLLKSAGKMLTAAGALLRATVPPHAPALRVSIKRFASGCGYLCGLFNIRAERYR